MKNLFKLFALALILFVSCDTGFNNNNNKKEEEPQEPKLLSFKVKGFWDYDNRYKTQTYTEAAEKLGTQDFVIKLGDFETLLWKDSLYKTNFYSKHGKEIEYVWEYESDEGYEFDATKIEVKSVECVTKELYKDWGDTDEEIVESLYAFFDSKKNESFLTYEIETHFHKDDIQERLQKSRYDGIILNDNLKVNLYNTTDRDEHYTSLLDDNQAGWFYTKTKLENKIKENNLDLTIDDYICLYDEYVMDEETGLRKVDENGNYIFNEDTIVYETSRYYMVQCAKITFTLDGCEAVCYVVF